MGGSRLSDHRYRVIMQYLQEDIDSIGSDPVVNSNENVESIPRAVNKDVRMEDNSVPEESDIACHQEVMTGYENKPIVPTSDGAEPLPRRCAPGAESNERLVLILNKSLPQMIKIDPQLFIGHHT